MRRCERRLLLAKCSQLRVYWDGVFKVKLLGSRNRPLAFSAERS